MGWTNSPPIFCAATETIADLANEGILKWRKPPHRLDDDDDASTPARRYSAVLCLLSGRRKDLNRD
jgi:hypothetical protein